MVGASIGYTEFLQDFLLFFFEIPVNNRVDSYIGYTKFSQKLFLTFQLSNLVNLSSHLNFHKKTLSYFLIVNSSKPILTSVDSYGLLATNVVSWISYEISVFLY